MVLPREELLGAITILDKDLSGTIHCNAADITNVNWIELNDSAGITGSDVGSSYSLITKDSYGSVAGGDITIQSGAGGTITLEDELKLPPIYGDAGNIYIRSGDGRGANAGEVSIVSGNGNGGIGGGITVQTGGGGSGRAGDLAINTGGPAGGRAGNLTISLGLGGSDAYGGGNFSLTACNGVNSSYQAGNVSLTAGAHTSAWKNGQINLTTASGVSLLIGAYRTLSLIEHLDPDGDLYGYGWLPLSQFGSTAIFQRYGAMVHWDSYTDMYTELTERAMIVPPPPPTMES
jgi:hypothetical protein